MTAATMQQIPAVPPRPSRSTEKDISAGPIPKVPPRPINKHLERSVSPNADRFAPSPLHEGIVPKAGKGNHLSPYDSDNGTEDHIDRSGSVAMPSVGEEGAEYSALSEELQHEQETKPRSASPEQTRHVGDDLKLHAPKPSLPALSAKQRVMTVTRTDSDKAASFGIGRPSEDRAVSRDSVRKRPSSVYSNTSDAGHHTEDEHGIPEIGQRVPMNPNLGDVQAPSPAPGSETTTRRHHRKHSSRSLPPGSYGLHGHGVAPQDKLEKAYYEKHPDLREKEHHTPIHDRQNDYAMSREDLNKLVRDTASRAAGLGTTAEIRGTPTDEAAFQASAEYASRISTPRPSSNTQKADAAAASQEFKAEVTQLDDEHSIHVPDSKHPECRSFGEAAGANIQEEQEYHAPILASDEIGKDPNAYLQHPAVHPPLERRGSAFEMEDAPSRPVSRPSSVNNVPPPREFDPTPLEDVKEYEPLFSDDSQAAKEAREALENKHRRHFPSKDIWEDAPNSVHFTAEVSTPEATDAPRRKSSAHHEKRPITPAQAFALHQEELAEKTAKGTTHNFLPLSEEKRPTWVANQTHLLPKRPASNHRFPSRDVWEDAPESQLHETTVSGSPKEESKPDIPAGPTKKSSESPERPVIPDRPKPKQQTSEEALKTRPPVSDKPKPHVPARPVKSSSGDSKDGDVPKSKPPVPSRPVGGKIAALQAGFMSDLNKRLQLGPQAPKKEEPAEQQDLTEEKDKAPLSDARKSRARGPQRRAPAKSPAPAAVTAEAPKPSLPTLSFSLPQTAWVIDPEEGSLAVECGAEDTLASPVKAEVPDDPEQRVQEAAPETAQPQELEQQQSEQAEVPEPEKVSKPQQIAQPEAPETEEKTLVTNTAGESILEETVEKKDDGNTVEPVQVSDEVKS